MELDHIFLRARPLAPEADLLRACGFTEGSGNRHPGQGTANRRFFFANAFVELLWIDDDADIRNDATRPTKLHERLGGAAGAASPFGVCFRPGAAAGPAPFPVWDYRPAYLPPGMAIGIGADVPLAEPMWFFVEGGGPPRGQPLDHGNGTRAITAVTITLPGGHGLSAAARAALGAGQVVLAGGGEHLMEIEFDRGAGGRRHDLRPALPLVLRF